MSASSRLNQVSNILKGAVAKVNMSNQEVILYDIPSRNNGGCWSLNPWKARASLNYKGIPYTTEWIEYPDIAPLLKGFGVEASKRGHAYSCPAARLPDGSYVMDSLAIARALDKIQPEPSLYTDTEYPEQALKLAGQFLGPVFPTIVARVPGNVLGPGSQPYFYETREKSFGKPITELPTDPETLDKAWESGAVGLKAIADFISENGDGPYVTGKEPSFADFVFAGIWSFIERLDQGGDLTSRLFGADPRIQAHWDACKKYFERDH